MLLRIAMARYGESEDRVTAPICRRPGQIASIHIVRPKGRRLAMACRKCQLLDYAIPQHTDRLDFTFDLVAGKAIAGRRDHALLGLPSATELVIDGPRGTCRRAGNDQHARLECEIDREEVDQFGACPDHVPGIAGLTELAIDLCLDTKRLRIADFVRGDDPGSGRRAGVESLPAAKLIPGETTGPPHLPIAGGHVVDDCVSEHVVKRVFDRDMSARLADNHRQFRLAIKLPR